MNRKRLQRLQSMLDNQIPLIGGSLRQMAARSLVSWGSPAALRTLAEAVSSHLDPKVSEIALDAFETLSDQPTIDAVILVWHRTRDRDLESVALRRGWIADKPPVARTFSALKSGQLSIITHGRGELAEPLIMFCQDSDLKLAEKARYCLENLRGKYIIDAICEIWAEKRDPLLTEILTIKGYIAQSPERAHILTRLKTGQIQGLENEPPGKIAVLVQACTDPDPNIAEQAVLVLSRLKNPESQQEACRLFLEHDNEGLLKAVITGDYTPRDENDRALYFFLTNQWTSYENLDFDHNRLRIIYDTGSPTLRERITRQIRVSGRADFLHIVAGRNLQGRLVRMSEGELHNIVQFLIDQKNWARLWELVFKLPLTWSLQAMLVLKNANWLPEEPDDLLIFQQLCELANQKILDAVANITQYIPPAVLRSRARLTQGRINAVAFSPDSPSLVMGTSRRRAAIWGYEQAQVITVIGDFNHSIGKVGFTSSGSLILGERSSSTESSCAVYSWKNNKTYRLLIARGAVTAITAGDEDHAFVTFRDSTAALINAEGKSNPTVRRFGIWARSACISPNQQSAAILHHGVIMLQLPQLSETFRSAQWDQVISTGCFISDRGDLIIGKRNGEVILFDPARYKTNHSPILKHQARIEGIRILQHHPIIITAGAEGIIQFTDLHRFSRIGLLGHVGNQITSLQIANDEAFMAVGYADGSVSLWDLRTLDLPDLLNQPLESASPNHLAALRALLENPMPAIPLAARQVLAYAMIALQFRLRYEIDVDALPNIKSGDFDIEID